MKPSPFMGERHDILTVELDDPAVGNMLSWAVPDNAVVQVVAVRICFITSVGVVDRHLEVSIFDGSVDIPKTPSGVIQPADKTWTYFFTLGIAPLDLTTDMGEIYAPLGCCYQLETGSSLLVNVTDIQPTDRLAAAAIRYFLWDRA